jgi:hypothetical protein
MKKTMGKQASGTEEIKVQISPSALSRVNVVPTVREVGEDFKNVVMEVHGATDRPAGILSRLYGKILSGVSTSSSIWSLTQLRFREMSAVVTRVDGLLRAASDLPGLPGFAPWTLPSNPAGSPYRPGFSQQVPAPFDWPQNSAQQAKIRTPADQEPPREGPMSQQTAPNLTLVAVPSPLTIDIDAGQSNGTTELHLRYKVDPSGPDHIHTGFWSIKASWTGSYLYLKHGMEGWANGGVIRAAGMEGATDEFQIDVLIEIDTASVPYGTTSVPIAFVALVDSNSPSPVHNVDGSGIGTTCVVQLRKYANGLLSVAPPSLTMKLTEQGFHDTYPTITVTNSASGSYLGWTATKLSDTSGVVTLSKMAFTPPGLTTSEVLTLSLSSTPAAGTYTAVFKFSAPSNADVLVTVTVQVLSVAAAVYVYHEPGHPDVNLHWYDNGGQSGSPRYHGNGLTAGLPYNHPDTTVSMQWNEPTDMVGRGRWHLECPEFSGFPVNTFAYSQAYAPTWPATTPLGAYSLTYGTSITLA